MPEDQRSPEALGQTLLEAGDIELKGRMPWSSNATFLVGVCLGDASTDGIYKPGRGERPLWDFPGGLYRREIAAYRLSESLGWGIVPETVLRVDAPLGEGSLQRFVDADFSEHYFTLLEREELHPQLRRMAVFDLLANNADRKGGHCLLTESDGRVWGIDHGVCFHDDPKLRTVIWDFAGEPIDTALLADVVRLLTDPPILDDLLHPREVVAFARRVGVVARLERFPDPASDRPYPWPLV
ncbi:MAG TPA: SCO1664 family protein [Acidimicrobiales bacterium]|nr:SCO1664 family protein [Acidimicrobiales bacterium]